MACTPVAQESSKVYPGCPTSRTSFRGVGFFPSARFKNVCESLVAIISRVRPASLRRKPRWRRPWRHQAAVDAGRGARGQCARLVREPPSVLNDGGERWRLHAIPTGKNAQTTRERRDARQVLLKMVSERHSTPYTSPRNRTIRTARTGPTQAGAVSSVWRKLSFPPPQVKCMF
jgi:hypothetical protein